LLVPLGKAPVADYSEDAEHKAIEPTELMEFAGSDLGESRLL
jgi:hypothetical protein